jgi:pyruvate dehydrogenase E1 component alpha subunit
MIGDGATNNGYFHEALNMSAIWDLPVIWIIENNLVAMGTRVEKASGQTELWKRAESYGMHTLGRIDGQNILEVQETVAEAVKYAREKGPVLIEAMTYRYYGHGVSDKTYDQRFAEELEYYVQHHDPITLFRTYLVDKYSNLEPELEKIEQAMIKVVEQSIKFAESSPEPDYNDLISNVYVTEGTSNGN